jgi:tetraacyldisaccharide 4'-kinase
LAGYIRRAIAIPWESKQLIFCVGNVVLGGAGKTPVSMDIGKRLNQREIHFNYLSRGYGGYERGPHLVHPATDDARRVGDEPLLLSKIAPTWVSRDRVSGAKHAIKGGVKKIIMDDGLQNPNIEKTFSIMIVDGSYGFGNGKVFPAGPLREPVAQALNRVGAVIIMGPDLVGIQKQLSNLSPKMPLLAVKVTPGPELENISSKRLTAFAAIANPEKFFSTLESSGCRVVNKIEFPDHHYFTVRDLSSIRRRAKATNSILVTTEKDWVRLPKDLKQDIQFLTIRLEWDDETALNSILDLFS